MSEYRTGIFPHGNCVDSPETNPQSAVHEFVQIDNGDIALEALEAARAACAQCVQLNHCQSQREDITLELWRRGVGATVVSGEHSITVGAPNPHGIDRPAFHFDLTKLPEDPKQALEALRQGWRADQLVVRGKPSKGAITISSQYFEQLKSTNPDLYQQAIDVLGEDEALHGVQTLASILFQQKDFTNYSNKKTKMTSVNASPDRKRTVSRYSPHHIELDKNASIIDQYVSEAISIRNLGYSKPANKAMIFDAGYYKALMEEYRDRLSTYTIDYTVTANRRNPAAALLDVIARSAIIRAANPIATEALVTTAATRKKYTGGSVEERVQAVQAAHTDVPYVTPGFIRSLMALNPNGDVEKLAADTVSRITRFEKEYKGKPYVDHRVVYETARTHYSDESCRKALDAYSRRMEEVRQQITHPEATVAVLRKHYSVDTDKMITNVTSYCDRLDRLMAISDGSVAPYRIREAVKHGAETWPEVCRSAALFDTRKLLKKHGYKQDESTRAALRTVSYKYPYAEIGTVGLALRQCMDQGYVSVANVNTELLPSDIHPDTQNLFTNKKHEYLALNGAFQHLSPEERLIFAHHYNLTPLLYGRDVHTMQMSSILDGRTVQQWHDETIAPALAELLKEPDAKTILSMEAISEDLYYFDSLFSQDSTAEPHLQSSPPPSNTYVVAGQVLQLQVVGDVWQDSDPRYDWLWARITSLYPPAQQETAFHHCVALIRSDVVNLIGNDTSGYRVILNNAFYADEVSDVQRAAAANSLGIDPLIYGNDLTNFLQQYPQEQTQFGIHITPQSVAVNEVALQADAADTETPKAEQEPTIPRSLEELLEISFGDGYHLSGMSERQRNALIKNLMQVFSRHIEHPNHRRLAKGNEYPLFLAWQLLQGADVNKAARRFDINPDEVETFVLQGMAIIAQSIDEMPASRLRPIQRLLEKLPVPRALKSPKPTPVQSAAPAEPVSAPPAEPKKPQQPKKSSTKKNAIVPPQLGPSDVLGSEVTPDPKDTPAQPVAAADPDAAEERLRNKLSPTAAGQHMSRAGKVALLTAAEEVDLTRAIEAGVFAQDYLDRGDYRLGTHAELQQIVRLGDQARQRMVEANLRLVIKRASIHSQRVRSMQLEDLISEGNMGLMHAVDMFDYTKGYKFSTYAVNWIDQYIRRAIGNQENEIRIPIHAFELLKKIKGFHAAYFTEHGTDPDTAIIAEALGKPISQIETALTAMRRQPISIHTPIGDEGAELGDFIEGVDVSDPSVIITEAVTVDTQTTLHRIFDEQFNTHAYRIGVRVLILRNGLKLNPSFISKDFVDLHGVEEGKQYTMEQVAGMLDTTPGDVRNHERRLVNMMRQPHMRQLLLSGLQT